ncbi:Hsp20/alpha crystallin family protein [Desulfosediminicola flagellatus]|uniref:Hsp20/alpha crystallin family protein n=1 Tax=Desulfosediminicola flagellatus TaxID=2569541 RepID=UPI0010AB961A|nr:Hsp20/alpha crystallin family protein [Desulfosediminicola flagellatus]
MSDTSEIMKREETNPEVLQQLNTVSPVVDIFENDEEILLYADMPGVAKENLSINIDNGKLMLSSTRRLGVQGAATWEEFGDVEFHRVFSIPQTIDISKVNAVLSNGVLQLHLPKSEAAKPKQIEIKVA